jgi:exopolysaccharide biosynthesis polyprenyl glycosylphosphotransferase
MNSFSIPFRLGGPRPRVTPNAVPIMRLGNARRLPASVYLALELSDVLIALLALGGALVLLQLGRMPDGLAEFLAVRIKLDKVLLLGLFGFCWTRIFRAFGLYRRSRPAGMRQDFRPVTAACTLGALATTPFLLFSASGSFTLGTVVVFWALSVPAVLGMRLAIRAAGGALSRAQWREVLIVGSGPRALALWRILGDMGRSRARVIGFVDTCDTAIDNAVQQRLVGKLGDLEAVLMRQVVDEVLIALPIKSYYEQIQAAIHTCERVGVQSSYLADLFQPLHGRVRYENAHSFPTGTVKVVHDDIRMVVKRIIDVVGAMLALVLLAPLLLLIAGALRLADPGPILFVQQRYGLNKRLFRMLKFRTMVSNAEALQQTLEDRNEAQGPLFKIAQDPRVTRLGRLLRKTSLDELPQLWNVLKGEMSLVGPRPLPGRDVGRFDEGRLMRRFSVRPGLTGLWQVKGRSDVSFERCIAMDLEYIDTWSLWLDVQILLLTVPAVLASRGAH